MTDSPRERVARVREAIAAAAAKAGRAADEVRLVAVSKTFAAEAVAAVHREGVADFGENRVQEAEEKGPQLPDAIRWHLVGHLQGNKAVRAVRLFGWIHSIDSPELARRVDRAAAEAGRSVEGLVQVDLAGEETKFGLVPEALPALLTEAAGFGALRIRGLMLLPPFQEDPEGARPFFARLRRIAESLEAQRLLGAAGRVELSMGMSHDYRVAVEEGATIVRVGTAIFGGRG
jgi:pyridoxal phosphate enzyme (YggS family)